METNVLVGPREKSRTVCLLCANQSNGTKCDDCNIGFYKDDKKKCVRWEILVDIGHYIYALFGIF